MTEDTPRSRLVHVRAYTRTRLGHRENVCAHTRSWPRQYKLDL